MLIPGCVYTTVGMVTVTDMIINKTGLCLLVACSPYYTYTTRARLLARALIHCDVN